MSKQPSPGGSGRVPTIAWRGFQLLTLAAMAWVCWHLVIDAPYRIDIDVYRMGAQAWLDGQPLYADGTIFHIQGDLDLPFTYPPLAAIVFAPFTWLPLSGASAAITIITLVLLVVSTVIVLTRLDVWPDTAITQEPAWLRRTWLATAICAPAAVLMEPFQANLVYGQINVVLMTLVIADCLPRRTPWPRGILLGLAIALKLTPAAFLLYFLLRRDFRALLSATAAALAATLAGFAFATGDSVEYWTNTVSNTGRIGTATLRTNQNIAGTLARFGLEQGPRFALWALASAAVLVLTVWAARRALRSTDGYGEVLALICVAMFGLAVSPVSWSHHWVWMLPTVLVTGILAYRRRDVALASVTALGVVLTVSNPIKLMTENHETSASLLRQLGGDSYLWWALAVLVVIGLTAAAKTDETSGVTPAPLVKLGGGEAA